MNQFLQFKMPSWKAIFLWSGAMLLIGWGINRLQPYLHQSGVRVEYSEGSVSRFDRVNVRADVRTIYIKKIVTAAVKDAVLRDVVSRDANRSPDDDRHIVPTFEKYTFAAGAPVKGFVVARYNLAPILFTVITPKGTTIPIFENGIYLDDGFYFISVTNEFSDQGSFTVKDAKIYLKTSN